MLMYTVIHSVQLFYWDIIELTKHVFPNYTNDDFMKRKEYDLSLMMKCTSGNPYGITLTEENLLQCSFIRYWVGDKWFGNIMGCFDVSFIVKLYKLLNKGPSHGWIRTQYAHVTSL